MANPQAFYILDERDTYNRQGRFASFYDIGDPFVLEDSDRVCTKCRRMLEPRIWKPPHSLFVSGESGDLVQGAGSELVVSKRFFQEFVEGTLQGLTELGTVSIDAGEFVVARTSTLIAKLDEEKSGVVWRVPPTCGVCRLGARKSIDAVYLNESFETDLDVFSISGFFSVTFVSQRFVDLVNGSGFTNFQFVNLDEYSEMIGS